jgi:hypothetical protein
MVRTRNVFIGETAVAEVQTSDSFENYAYGCPEYLYSDTFLPKSMLYEK